METVLQDKTSTLLEKFSSSKKFYEAEAEGFGPCSILLLGQVRIYDDVINKISRIRPGLLREDLNHLLEELKQKIIHCSGCGMNGLEKMVIKTYEEIRKEIEAIL